VLFLLAGCPSETIDSEPALCDQGESRAENPATGECLTFASASEVPVEWEPCVAPARACTEDASCPATEHCAGGDADGPGVCMANAMCSGPDDCAGDLVCDATAGLCARPTSGMPPLDPGGQPSCVVNSQCSELEICPAQYGGCSAEDDRDVVCPSRCELACLADEACGEGLRCNASEICGEANGEDQGSPPLVCSGWCVPAL
jgi:hypothetical protein